jgi:hypothetical protein
VTVDAGSAALRYRLLETTRAYLLEKLLQAGEFDAVARRHAERYRDLLEVAEAESTTRPTGEWLADYVPRMDNLRAALDWAFSPRGDAAIGVAVASAAIPLWTRLSLFEEVRSRGKQALGVLGTGGTQDARHEMNLWAALAASLIFSPHPGGSETNMALTRALEIAENLDDAGYRFTALWGQWAYHTFESRYRVAFDAAQRFYALAAERPDANDRIFGRRMIGAAQHFIGDQSNARNHLEQFLSYNRPSDQAQDIGSFQNIILFRFGGDLRLATRAYLARVLWLQGLPEQAVRTTEMSIEEAYATGVALSLCWALALGACQIALWMGDLAAAERHTGTLIDHARKHSLPLWTELGAKLQSVVVLKGDDAGRPLPQVGLDEIAPRNFDFLFLGEFSEALAHAGRIAEAFRLVDQASGLSEVDWLTPELLRLKGELLLVQGTSGVAGTAEDLFWKALDLARQQEALSWELRAATSLARLLRDQDRSGEALALLQPVYNRFTEGFDTADLKKAKLLLGAL